MRICARMPISPSASHRLAVTLGDPAGIGPEVALKAIRSLPKTFIPRILLIGKASLYESVSRKLKFKIQFKDIANPCDRLKGSLAIPCYYPGQFPDKLVRGRSDAAWTRCAVRSIETAVSLALRGQVGAIVTPPINKAGLRAAGFKMPGHTEYLAELSGTRHFDMMLVGGGLRVVVVTRHLALKDVPKNLSAKGIENTIILTARELEVSFGIQNPRLAVLGLNPHAGEEGRFGDEEGRLIVPAIRSCRKKKIRARLSGPHSPDTVFYEALDGRYDAQICMYHDQGLIPLKMISRGHGVNVTLGLPFVRTSPDHGTAYDIASRFIADAGSMRKALELAAVLSKNRGAHA